jgi:hypothetical protein
MTGRPELSPEQCELLDRVKAEREYYGPLLPSDDRSLRELSLLRELQAAGYVRFCPYPEEFWIAVG